MFLFAKVLTYPEYTKNPSEPGQKTINGSSEGLYKNREGRSNRAVPAPVQENKKCNNYCPGSSFFSGFTGFTYVIVKTSTDFSAAGPVY